MTTEDERFNTAPCSHDFLKSCLRYNADSGELIWLDRPASSFANEAAHKNFAKRFVGKVAGAVNSSGYVNIDFCRKKQKAHRLVWFYVTGEWPQKQIDHINLTRSDNRFENLRECSYQQNQANTLLRQINTSGFKGVSLCKVTQRWRARIRINGKVKCLGRYSSRDEAHKAYADASNSAHGEFSKP